VEAPQRTEQAKTRAANAQAALRALRVELGALAPGRLHGVDGRAASWIDVRSAPAPFARAASGGTALAVALLARELRWPDTRSDAPALALGVAPGVLRGLPTAARASVHGFGVLHGRYGEGQVGGDLGPLLGRLCDALLLCGRASTRCGVLVLDARARGPRIELVDAPELAAASPRECHDALVERFGPAAILRVGPAALRGVAFANLASAGASASFVGRGGLGARFASLGLKALVVRGALPESPDEPPHDARGESADAAGVALRRLLVASPRLLARSAGGTLELFHAYGARGESSVGSAEQGHRLALEARARGVERHGCRGCPTPCGWEFARGEASGADAQRAHFGAVLALGPALGLESFAEQLELLAACDRAGLDAREMGALLELACARDASLRGDAPRMIDRIDALARGEDADPPARLGALAYARAHGLEAELASAQGQSARRERAPAAELGQHTSAGGSDPLRSFPFLAAADGSAHRLRSLVAPLPLAEGSDDPLDPRGKGRLVWWHENLAAAFDLSGFCAFSGGALLADGVCTLDELARAVAPPAVLARAPDEPARAWLAAGAELALLRRALDPVLGDVPEELCAPGLLPEYLRCRGVARDGALDPRALAAVGSLRSGEPWTELEAGTQRASSVHDAGVPQPSGAVSCGRVQLRTVEPLSDALGSELELALPCTLAATLDALSIARPRARAALFDSAGAPRVAVFRAGERLAPHALVAAGDVLDVVGVIGGG
jgi:aldehyde:ferredoxin oxidoreductase